ncbi:MAG: DUF4190 domain-containing protein [Luteolibacter sp.]
MTLWFYAENGTQAGPVDDGQFRELITQGRISPETLVWRDGMPTWLPLNQVDLSVCPPPFPAQGVAGLYGAPPTSGLAITSLVCGVLGFFCMFLSPAAVICGHMALSQIENADLPISGKGLAIAGLICGYLWILATVVMIVVAFASGPSVVHP